jgi:hypothetical protein
LRLAPDHGAWLAVALVGVGVSRARVASDWVWLVAAGAAGFALTLLWPYYSVLDLARDTGGFDVGNKAMYRDVVLRLFPALIGLWVVWRRFHADRRDLLGVLLVGGLAIYAYGYVRDEYGYGRSLALVVLVLDVAAADGVARLERGFRWGSASRWLRMGAVALGALLVLGLVETRGGLVRMVPGGVLPTSVRTSDEFVRVDDRYAFLERHVGADDVVIGARNRDNQVIPAISGQPLRPFWPPVPKDAGARAAAQAEFLDPATPSARRAEIAAKYKARFVLVHRRDPETASVVRALESSGARIVYDRNGFQLLALRV